MDYVELHCKSNYSFLEGASHPEELVDRAGELGYGGLAITDRNSLAGVVRAHAAAKDRQLKLILGAELTPVDAPPVLLWATDRAAYGRLSRLLTVGRRRAAKGTCQLTFADLTEHAAGLLAGVLDDPASEPDLVHPDVPRRYALGDYHELYGERCYLVCELLRSVDDAGKLDQLRRHGDLFSVPLIAAGDVHYHSAERLPLQHVLTAIRQHTTVNAAGPWRFPNAERHLRPRAEIEAIYADAPELLRRTVEVAERCRFSLSELRYEYPEELAPEG